MSDDLSPVLSLPLIQSAQAQKHVTHNEALRILDILVQPAVASRSLAAPPVEPEEGARYIVPAGATGAWAGRAGALAHHGQGEWGFLWPLPGWQAHVADEGAAATFADGQWRTRAELPLEVARLGIATAADDTNRLAVAAPATLLTHAGAGHQLKLNKAAAADTASLLFQTAWSGRAEMGTAGGDGFSIKVSPDGAAWTTALGIAPAGGRLGVGSGADLPAGTAAAPALAFAASPGTGLFHPAADQLGLAAGGAQRMLVAAGGVQIGVPVTGAAVTQSATDTTAGRLTRVGDYGLPTALELTAAHNLNDIMVSGLYYNPTGANVSGNNYPVASAGALLAICRTSVTRAQYFVPYNAAASLYLRTYGPGGWSPWRRIDPERGGNANGDYVRLADGTQICTGRRVQTALALGSAFHGGFRASYEVWTFPAAFAAPPEVLAAPLLGSAFGVVLNSPSNTAVGFSPTAVASSAAADRTTSLTAIGRWY